MTNPENFRSCVRRSKYGSNLIKFVQFYVLALEPYRFVIMDVIYKPFSVGGDSRLSLAARRNLRRVSQVSLVKMADSFATPSIVLRTLWHNRACRFTKSDPKTYHIHVLKFEF